MKPPVSEPDEHRLDAVLRRYEPVCGPLRIEPTPLGEPGFSGARIFRCVAGRQFFCLRVWPAGTDPERVRWIHKVLDHVARSGAHFVPVPVRTADGRTLVCDGGSVYHLEPWMAGRPCLQEETEPPLVQHAIDATAEWHRLAAGGPHPADRPSGTGPSAIVEARRRMLHRLLALRKAGAFGRLHDAQPSFRALATAVLSALDEYGPRMSRLLETACTWRVPRQPIVRDLRCQHFLFIEDRLNALIDYGATCIDTVACDLARLLATLPPLNTADRERWLNRYARLRTLTPLERRLVDLLEASGTLLSGANWVRRYCEEREPVDDSPAVLQRMQSIARHLPDLPILLDRL
ncbi:MAG: hypothetical protein D6725_04320 [Planctomycetota bacterium]|nr:MAG: hypothetical protein D6725_04320 [Planctomycetota bacterium]